MAEPQPMNPMDERMNPKKERSPRPAASTRRDAAPQEIDSRLLLGSQGRVEIRHRGETYRLQETRFGKLILTK